MEKAAKMGKVSVTGSFQLFVGKALSTVLLAIGSIIMARLMEPAEYGLYTIALVPSMTICIFHDWGIGQAMAKYIARARNMEKDEEIADIIITGLTFKAITGLALSIISLFLTNYIAIEFFNRPETAPLISIVSFVVLSDSLLTAAQSNFTGFERMELTSLTMTCQAILKTAIAPALVLVGYGALGAVIGHTVSYLIAGITSVLTLYFLIFKNLKKLNKHRLFKVTTLKKLLRYGVPLSFSTMLGSILTQLISFLMVVYCNDVNIGNNQVAANFAIFLAFFSYPIATVLFPAFSKLNSKTERQLLKTIFTSAVKYSSLFLVPATMITIVLAEPLVSIVFGQKWIHAPFFLTLHVIINLFVIFGNLVNQSFLAGVGETKILLKLGILNLSLGIPLAFILIPPYGIVGVILGNLFAGIPGIFLSLYWLWKHYNIKPNFKISTKIFLAALIATATAYISLNLIINSNLMKLTIGATVFLATYIIVTPVLGGVTKKDIQTLRNMFSGLKVISRLIDIPLSIAEKVLSIMC